MSWKPVGSHLFPGGCFVVESDVPQPDFKQDVFIGSAQQLKNTFDFCSEE